MCMYTCISAYMSVYVCIVALAHVSVYACMYVCMHVCMYVCMYVCILYAEATAHLPCSLSHLISYSRSGMFWWDQCLANCQINKVGEKSLLNGWIQPYKVLKIFGLTDHELFTKFAKISLCRTFLLYSSYIIEIYG